MAEDQEDREGQPSGEQPEETTPAAAETPAEPEGNEEQAPAAEEPAPAAAEEEEPASADEPEPVTAEEEPAPAAAEEEPAPAAAEEEEPAPAAAEEDEPALSDEPDPVTAEEPALAPAEEEPAPADEPEPVTAEEPDSTAAKDEAPSPAGVEEAAPAAAEASAAEAPTDADPAEGAPEGAQRRQRPPTPQEEPEEAVVPGAHLEPDLVLEEKRSAAEGEFDPYATADDDLPVAEGEQAANVDEAPAPAARTPLDLAADARYPATGKRKRAIARVILKPGEGTYTINGKGLDVYFPRTTLQKTARLPLETAGYETRMDVVAKIHGGGVSAQAVALRHGIARALVEADPNLRTELKRHGFLTRDARVKERKKAGLKKARKRPQFSKR